MLALIFLGLRLVQVNNDVFILPFNERDAIVLTESQYKQAYKTGHQRILNSLWERRGLVLIGYGFADPWIDFISQGALEGFVGPPRHFALIGVDEGEYEDRRYFEKTYGVRPVFYPVRPDHDHSALLETLDALQLYADVTQPPRARRGRRSPSR